MPTKIVVGSPVTVKTIITMSPVVVGGSTAAINQTSLWTGEGEPHLVVGASVGDEYLDTITGNIYRLDPGA